MLSIQALLSTPNSDDPLDPDIGKKWRENEALAIKTAVTWTRLYASPTAPAQVEENRTQTEDNTATTDETTQTDIDESPFGFSARALPMRPTAVPQTRPDVFRYGSLGRADETRILRLYPGLPSDPLVGIIQHITLPSYMHGDSDLEFFDGPETPAYETLSYAWGKPEVTNGIYLHAPNSKPENARMLGLAENCALALRRLRHPDKERPLWVDAICINQADVTERSAQVRIMHRIYKTASRVLIYLGEGNAATDQAIAILEEDANGRRQCITDSTDPDEEISLQIFFSLPWFKRVWVLQEVAWAATALAFCGSRVVSWETLHNAYTSSIGRIDRLQPLPHVLSFGEPRPDGEMGAHELFMELKNARACDASDPRDKIFALLELFHKRPEDSRLTIDYERGVSDLYTDVSLFLINQRGLDVLAETHNEPSRVPGLVIPSWVINWAAPPRPTYRFDGCFAGGRDGGGDDTEFPPSPMPEPTLRSRRNTGPARHRHPPDEIPRGDAPRRKLRVHAAFLYAVGASPTSFGFPGSSIQDWDSPENVSAFEQLMEHIQKVESSTSNSDQFDINRPAPPDMSGFRSRWSPETKRTKQMLAKLRNRKIFTTENGLPAIGPLHTQGGDRIFAFQHTSMCHVLRPTSQTDVYTYVGDCFLYGHMQLWWNAIQGRGPAVRHDVGDGPKEAVPWEEVVIY